MTRRRNGPGLLRDGLSPRRGHLKRCALLAMILALACGGCSKPAPELTGIWKADCKDYWGVRIAPAANGLYAVTFCGLSGCLDPGAWTPDTPIEGDPMYQRMSERQLRIRRKDGGYFEYIRCSTDPHWTADGGK